LQCFAKNNANPPDPEPESKITLSALAPVSARITAASFRVMSCAALFMF